jgi:serine phosphatase RsbU (regulator of sigma subunit)
VSGPSSSTQRLAVLRESGLGATSDLAFETYAGLVRRLLGVPVALVSLVDDERQFFPGAAGLASPWNEARQTPLSHSLCQHVVASGKELVVTDATGDPVLCDNLAIPDLGVIGYAGMPLTDADGHVLGSLCAIDTEPREWSVDELDTLRDLAEACSAELRLRITSARAEAARTESEAARTESETARAESEAARTESEAARTESETARAESEAARERAERMALRLQLVGRVGQAVGSTLDADEALRRLAALLVPVLGDWAAAYRLDLPDLVRRVAVAPPRAGEIGDLPRLRPDGGALTQVLAGRRPYAVLLPSADAHGGDPLSAVHTELVDVLGGGHLLVVGLRVRERVLGALVLGRTDRAYGPEDRGLALDIAERASLALDNAGLYQVQRGAAATLQSMLLTRLPAPRGLRLAARYSPAVVGADVGGDWYDAFALSEDSTMLAIGDVVGHDLRAAGQMGQIRGMLRTLAYDRGEPPAALLTRLDRALTGLSTGTLATGVLARLDRDPATGVVTVRWSNAGHPPPVLLHADERSRLLDEDGAHGLMLGVRDSVHRGEATVRLETGDTLLLFTDGLVESRTQTLEHGLLRLRNLAARHATASPEQLCDAVVDGLTGPDTTDDAAMLAVRVS